MRHLPAVVVLLGLLALPADAQARLNPLKQAKGTVKPEVIIIFDTSGSMMSTPSGTTTTGSDCGPDVNIDLPGDLMCTGSETSGADCAITSHSTASAGMPAQCSSASISRMALAKRAVQNVLSDIRGQASFGMVIYNDGDYFRYYPVTPPATPSPVEVSILLTRLELESDGSWTGGQGWGSTSCGTLPSCPRSFTGPDSTTAYTLLPTGTTTPNSLYRRPSGSSYAYKRMDWCGLSCPSGGYTWTYVGSYFKYTQSDGVNYSAGSEKYITSVASGGAITSTASSGTYWGPQVVRGTTTYVHYRFDDGSGGITGTSAAKMLVPLHKDLGSSTDAQFQAKTAAVLNRVNTAFNGGVVSHGSGGTPNIAALSMAAQMFADRAAGSCANGSTYPGGVCPYTGSPDTLAGCRKRAVLLITDGDCDDDPPSLADKAKMIFCQGCANPGSCVANDPDFTPGTGNCDPATSNPINVFVVALVPSPSTDMNNAADWGDDGILGNGGSAYDATSEATLTQSIRDALGSAVSGDFVTGAAGISTSGLTNVTGDWAILPSVEVPDWKGHLRAYRLNKEDGDTTDPPILEWDAADILNDMNLPLSRRILTGHPQYNPGSGVGYPVDLYLNGSMANFPAVRTIASNAGSTVVGSATDAELQGFFLWLYGASRSHRLGPILRCTPATIGPPSQYNLADNSVFATDNASRETLIYVTSNDGLIHAFRTGRKPDGGGQEVFAFIPPNLLDRVYALYLQDGQPNSVDSFNWILANSPRVEDQHVEPKTPDAAPTGATVSNRLWRTHLLVAMGPYVHGFVGLDITNPTDTSSSTTPYPLRSSKPFRVVALMHEVSAGGGMSYWLGGTEDMTGGDAAKYTYGEGWSVPAFYWIVNNQGEQEPHMSCGSGYGAPTSGDRYKTIANKVGHYYYYYAHGHHIGKHKFGDSNIPDFYNDPSAVTLQVDTAVLADTAGVRDEFQEETLPVIAIYQANMLGQIRRFDKGTVQTPATKNPVLIPAPSTADPSNPFYYSPAALHLGSTKAAGTEDNEVILAANSGAADEELTSAPEATLFLRSETDGTVDGSRYRLTCKVSQLGSGTCTEGSPDTTGTLFSSCTGGTCSTVGSTWPSNKAKPVGTPILVYNDPDGTGALKVEAFYLLYEEASGTTCAASTGKSWLIRVSVDAATGMVNTMEEVTKVSGRASGMSLAGSGTRVVLSMSGTGTSPEATMGLGVQGAVQANPVTENPPMIEFWREIK